MPELPDIAAYIAALEPRWWGSRSKRIRLASPFLSAPRSRRFRKAEGRTVRELRGWEAHSDRFGRRHLARAAPDDRRPPALEARPCLPQGSPEFWRLFDFLPNSLTLTEPAPSGGHPSMWWRASPACSPWTRAA